MQPHLVVNFILVFLYSRMHTLSINYCFLKCFSNHSASNVMHPTTRQKNVEMGLCVPKARHRHAVEKHLAVFPSFFTDVPTTPFYKYDLILLLQERNNARH